MVTVKCIYMYIYIIYIYIYIFIYIYIYIERERERKRETETERRRDRERQGESIQQEINFLCKSFRQRLYQLHIYNKILLQSSNLQILFLQILIFDYYRNGNTNMKKLTKRQLRQNCKKQY